MLTLNKKQAGLNTDLSTLSSRMMVAYLLASLVLCSSIAFSYIILRNVLEQQAHLSRLTTHTAHLQLAIRNSAFHMAELKKVKNQASPGSRLEGKVKAKLDGSHKQILQLRDEIARELVFFKQGKLHKDILQLFYRPQQSLLVQLDNYSDRLADLVLNKDNQTPGIALLWLPVEAAAAFDGSLVKTIRQALSRLDEIVADRSVQLSVTHTRLSWFAIVVVILELVLIFLPLSLLLKGTNKRLLHAHNELYTQANYDIDTGLRNQAGMIERFSSTDTMMKDGALLIIRVLETEKIHNIAGPTAMGHVFSELAHRLTSRFGNEQSVFRTGDAEFTVFVPDTTDINDRSSVCSLQARLTSPVSVANVKIYPQVILGYDRIAGYSVHVVDRQVNARLAAMLYEHAKVAIPHYNKDMRARIDQENLLAEEIRIALVNKEFVPFYQIKVDAVTGQPCGMEALCRWVQPDGNWVPPFRFIPVAENSGLIAELTWLMLEQIVNDWNRWNCMGLDPGRIAFNAAQGFLMDENCCLRFNELTASMNQDDCPIDLEITENVALSNTNEHVFSVLDGFRQMNIPIALDDFGTGFASLNSIIKMNIDIIKVDQQFVQKMTECKDSHNVVVTILNLCKLLNKKSVVEGVETEEQWRACRSIGCDEIQGYYFFKPENFETVSRELLHAQTPQGIVMRKAG